MNKKINSTLTNFTLLVVSILILFMVFEFIVFRFFLVASDVASLDFVNGIVRYTPNQKGVWRIKNEIKAKFQINSSGWNSGYKEYRIAKDLNKYRIAIIGDSYMDAFQVDYNRSVAEQLESKLGYKHFQVYRFGIAGAPLSQYLHMLRREVLQYNPDLVIVNLVHNDFDQSYKFKPGVYMSSFMKLKIDNDSIFEKEPIQYEKHWYSWIRKKSATWGYLAVRQQVRFNLLRKIILGQKKNNREFRTNINVSIIKKNAKNNQLITDYIFQKIKDTCDSKSISLLIIMDGDRGNIYDHTETNPLFKEGILALNRMVAFVAIKHNIKFIDLHNIFRKDYIKNKKSFNFINDAHWNSYAHGLVADTLADYIRLLPVKNRESNLTGE